MSTLTIIFRECWVGLVLHVIIVAVFSQVPVQGKQVIHYLIRAGTHNLLNGYFLNGMQVLLCDCVMCDAGSRRVGCMAISGVLSFWNVVVDINTA